MKISNKSVCRILFLSGVAALGGFLFGYDSGVINGAVSALQEEFGSGSVGSGFNVAAKYFCDGEYKSFVCYAGRQYPFPERIRGFWDNIPPDDMRVKRDLVIHEKGISYRQYRGWWVRVKALSIPARSSIVIVARNRSPQ